MNSELLPLKRNLSELSALLNPEIKLLQFSELLNNKLTSCIKKPIYD